MAASSFFSRWWKAVQPPTNAQSRGSRIQKQKRKQSKVLLGLIAAAVLLGAAGFGYNYMAGAPERARTALALATEKMAPGSYDAAIVRFNRALEISPQLAEAYLGRGIAERNLNQIEPAMIDLEKALDLDATLTTAHDELGQIYSSRGDTRRALEEFSQSVKAKPTANGYYQRGQLHEKLGEHQEAVNDYNLAIEELSESPYVYFARATARGNLGDTEGAQADRSKAISLATETGHAP